MSSGMSAASAATSVRNRKAPSAPSAKTVTASAVQTGAALPRARATSQLHSGIASSGHSSGPNEAA